MEEIEGCMKDMLDKVCKKEWGRRYYQKNKEKIIKKSRGWNKKNPEKVLANGKKYDKSVKFNNGQLEIPQ